MDIYKDWSEKWTLYSGEKVAIKQYETKESYTYNDIFHLSNSLSHRLTDDYGIKKGDRLVILSENKISYMVLFAAAQKTGAIIVPLNIRMTQDEILQQIEIIDSSLLIASERYRNILNSGCLKDLPFLDMKSIDDENRVESKLFPQVEIEDNDPLMILFTSGSSGIPKGAIYSHKMCTWNSLTTSLSLILNGDSRTINCMPLFHTGGWNVLMLPIFHHGGYTCLIESFDADSILKMIETEKPTIFMGVPTMLKMMSQSELFDSVDLSSLLYIIVGGEAMDYNEIQTWHRRGVAIRQGYGMTEVGPNLTSLHHDDADRKLGSIGKPNFYVEIKLIDKKGKEVLGEGVGELLLKGPMVTPGYWANIKETNETIKSGWFYTGDLIKRDGEGFLYVIDRIKNMYISGGENVYPLQIEKVIKTFPGIIEAVVVPVPHEKWGEAGKAYIQTNDNVTFSIETLTSFMKEKLASYKIPKHFLLIDDIPKNDANKIDRKKLKSMH